MRRPSLLGAALALAGLGCDPIELVVKEPVVERVLVMPDQHGDHTRRFESSSGIGGLRDAFADERPPMVAHVLTADTDPSQIDGGTIVPGVATFPCVLPGASSAWCARAVSGPFVVTDLETSAGCGDRVVVAALTSRMVEAPRWSLKGALAAHGGRLALRQDELLFVAAALGAPPAPIDKKAGKHSADPPMPAEPESRCSITWGGFRPYGGEEMRGEPGPRRRLDQTLDVPDALDPSPHLGGTRAPRTIVDKLETNVPNPLIPGPMTPGF